MKLEQNFNDITILMLTNNRPHTLLRNLSFINSYGYKIKIIILDSSLKKKNIKSFNNLNIRYLQFDASTPFHNKLYFSLKYIETKFCVPIADDDFFFMNSIYKCLDFLRKKNEFASVYGNVFTHSDFSRINKGLFLLHQFEGKKIKSHLSDSNKIRIKNFISNKIYFNHYCVCRTNIFKKAQTKIYHWSKGRSAGEYDELIYNILILNYGKSKFLKIPYCSREPNYRSYYLFDSKSFEDSYKKYNLSFVKFVSNLLQKKKTMFKNYLLEIMSKRLEKLMNKNNLNINKSVFFSFKVFLSIIKTFFKTNIFPKKYYGLDYSEIKKVKKFIMQFPDVQNEIKNSRLLRRENSLSF